MRRRGLKIQCGHIQYKGVNQSYLCCLLTTTTTKKPQVIAASELLELEMTSRGQLLLALTKHRVYLMVLKSP